MPPKPRRVLRIEGRRSRNPDSHFHRQPAGIYESDLDAYEADQKGGNTIAQLEPFPERTALKESKFKRPKRDRDAVLGLPEPTQFSVPEPLRQITMTTGRDDNGQVIYPHYQSTELSLNSDGLTHDLIHVAITVVLRRHGFISAATELLETEAGRKTFDRFSGNDDWPESARIEEAIENALEKSGIRRGKINERFWEHLQTEAAEHNVPVPDITPQQLGEIADELNAMSTRMLDDEPHDYPLPPHRPSHPIT